MLSIHFDGRYQHLSETRITMKLYKVLIHSGNCSNSCRYILTKIIWLLQYFKKVGVYYKLQLIFAWILNWMYDFFFKKYWLGSDKSPSRVGIKNYNGSHSQSASTVKRVVVCINVKYNFTTILLYFIWKKSFDKELKNSQFTNPSQVSLDVAGGWTIYFVSPPVSWLASLQVSFQRQVSHQGRLSLLPSPIIQ